MTARTRAAVPTGEVHPAAAVWPMLANDEDDWWGGDDDDD